MAATDVGSKAWFQLLLWLFAVAHIVDAHFMSVLVFLCGVFLVPHVINTKSSHKRGMLLKQYTMLGKYIHAILGTANAQTCLSIRAVSPEPLLLGHVQNGCR